MFSQKKFVVFISKNFIEPGFVFLGNEPSFEGQEAFQYTKETLIDSLKKLQELSQQKMRIVLSEELVYVTEISFPQGTKITRESVREKTAEIIPEDLKKTEWDFQMFHYAEKVKNENDILIQVAVIEKSFSESFRSALQSVPLSIEAIYPESYVLANFEKEEDGTLIIERDREVSVLCVVSEGFVIVTDVMRDPVTKEDIEALNNFVSLYKGKTLKKIFLSHCEESELLEILSHEGYEVITKEYNPLLCAALVEKVSGKDEDILNIDIFSSVKEKKWWQFF